MTYAELESQTNAIANGLIQLDIDEEVVVGILARSRSNVISAMIGIVKSGRVFCVLDPSTPTGRLQTIIAKVGIGALVVEEGLKEAIGIVLDLSCRELTLANWAKNTLHTSCLISGTAVEASPKVSFERDPSIGAYIYLTSGSTGGPKAILGRLKGVIHFISWEIETFTVERDTRVSQITNPCFDAFLRDVFTPLCAGGTVCIPASEMNVYDGKALCDWIGASRINLIHCVPSLFRRILGEPLSIQHFPSLRYVLLSGEVIYPTDVRRWMSVFGSRIQLVNLYGPTETTMTKFVHFVTMADAGRRSVPIGLPIPGARALLMDDEGRPCPSGQVGEIYIRTPYRAVGYVNEPEATAKAFIRNPLNPEDPNDLVYRTGDLGRVLEDGVFEFVGRRDTQVKLSGVRIELGEIERILREHDAVADVAVVIRENSTGEEFLAGYVVLRGCSSLDSVREFVAKRLPGYMLPQLMRVESLPVLQTGKVDRHALPAFELEREGHPEQRLLPRNSIEMMIVSIYERVLGATGISVEDEFFALGGNSLQAARLITEINSRFGVNVPLTSLLENRSVLALSSLVADKIGSDLKSVNLPPFVASPMDRHDPFPLTDVQQAYWVGRTGAIELGNVATHTYIEFEMKNLDLDRFTWAWQRLIDRHDMLRTVILSDGRQRTLKAILEYKPGILDLRSGTSAEVIKEIEAIRSFMSHQILSAEQWPLFEIRLTLLNDCITRIHISYDLLICDAFSNAILARELAHYYYNPGIELQPLGITFRDYVMYEQALRNADLYRWAKEYWMRRIDELPRAPKLPLKNDIEKIETPRFAHQSFRMDSGKWSNLKRQAARFGITPSGLLIAAMAEVLSYWSESKHYCINVTLFNRLPCHPEVNGVVGDFTSITLLEVDHRSADTFVNRARKLQHQLWQDMDHRCFSGVEVIREVTRRLGGTRRALYPVVFTSTLVHGGLREGTVTLFEGAKQVYRSSQTSQVWLDNVAVEEDGSLVLRWNAVEELFPAGMLEDMFGAYRGILEKVASDSNAWHQQSDLLPADQRARRREVNATDYEQSGGLLQDEFSRHARSRPERLAVIDARRSLTYRELDRMSSGLGKRLRELGVMPDKLVAIVMKKGWEQIVGVMGALKAGGAYLPVDPEIPAERLRYILENGEVDIVLTQSGLNSRIQWPGTVKRLCVDQEDFDLARDLEPLQTPLNLGYVMYTSGSTGAPKGVMITQQAMLNRILDVNRRLGMRGNDRSIGLTSLHHDLSVFDIFGPLTVGGAIVLPEPKTLRDPTSWINLIQEKGVTIWNSVPAFMEMLVDVAENWKVLVKPILPSLRLVMLSGDWIPTSLPNRIEKLSDAVQVVSLGGPTEVTVWDVCYPIINVDPSWASIPYGKPMANQHLYVLDEGWCERPDWVPGEIVSAGVGLARGYWRDDVSTADRFLIHPSSKERLYRTGDLGRYLPDGNIELLGRTDFQVKLQGWRIELGEIEAVLRQHPSVKNAVVITSEERGRRQLTAFVVPQGEVSAEPECITSDLSIDPLQRLVFKLSKPGRRKEAEITRTRLQLPPDPDLQINAFTRRRSYRSFTSGPIAFEDLSKFLYPLIQKRLENLPLTKSRYASAGGLYPVQLYLYVKARRIMDLAAGAYYYDPYEHELRLLSGEISVSADDYSQVNRSVFEAAAFSIFLVGKMSAIRPIYGERSRDFCMIEAGLLSQLLDSEAVSSHIGLCHTGGIDAGKVKEWFQLDGNHEYLHGLVGGGVSDEQVSLSGLVRESEELAAAVAAVETGISSASGGPEGWESMFQGTLREFLRTKLPDYMVPSSIRMLDNLPLSANGKVDRQRLIREKELSNDRIVNEPKMPMTETERAVAEIWCETLGLRRVDLHDNFFDLGGNSVQVIRVHLKLTARFGVDIPLVEMFRNPTVNDLVRLVSSVSEGGGGTLDQVIARARRQVARFSDTGKEGIENEGSRGE